MRRKGFSKSLQWRKSAVLSAECNGLFIFVYVVVWTVKNVDIVFLTTDVVQNEHPPRFKPYSTPFDCRFSCCRGHFPLRKMSGVKIKNPKHVDASKTYRVRTPVRSLFRSTSNDGHRFQKIAIPIVLIVPNVLIFSTYVIKR